MQSVKAGLAGSSSMRLFKMLRLSVAGATLTVGACAVQGGGAPYGGIPYGAPAYGGYGDVTSSGYGAGLEYVPVSPAQQGAPCEIDTRTRNGIIVARREGTVTVIAPGDFRCAVARLDPRMVPGYGN